MAMCQVAKAFQCANAELEQGKEMLCAGRSFQQPGDFERLWGLELSILAEFE